MAAGALGFGRIRDWTQGLRSRRLAAKAEAEILGGNLEEAVSRARNAYQTKPDEPAAIRVSAKVQRLAGQPAGAVPLWKQLEQTGAMQKQDRLQYAEDLMKVGAVIQAGEEIEALMKQDEPGVALNRLAARWAALEGDAAKARDYAAKALRLEPENQETRFLLGVLLFSGETGSAREEGARLLLELGSEPSKEGLDALVQLGTAKEFPKGSATRIIELLRAHPLATEQHRVLAFGIEFAVNPDARPALLDAAVENYRKAEPAAQCVFGMWLHLHGEYERMLQLISQDEAFKRQDLLRVSLEALAGLRRYDEIERILRKKGVPLDNAFRELYLARCAEELGNKSLAELHWKRAQLAAGPSPRQMAEIAAYAEKLGRLDHAESAYRSLSASANTARNAMEALLRIAQQRGDVGMLCETLKTMKQRWPQDDSVTNDLAYFNLLLGKAVEESFEAAKVLVNRSPKSLAHRTTFALAALRKGEHAAAMSAYQGIHVPWDRVSPRYRIVYAAALGASGKSDEARAQAATLDWAHLLPQERELIQQWRTQ